MADKRIYEVVFIINPDADDNEVMRLSEAMQKIVTGQGGSITKTEVMGRRQLAYEINQKREGTYVLLEVEGSGADACRVAEALNLFTLAPSLGGVDSLVTIPVLTSHYLIDPELLKKMGVTEQMIRLSVGVEHVEDLIADLEKGLAVLSRKRERVGVAG